MPDFLRLPISFWWMLLVGIACIVGEFFVSGEYFLWSGLTALVVAMVMYWVPAMPFLGTLVSWLLLSVLAIIAARYYHKGESSFAAIAKPKAEDMLGVITTLQDNSKEKLGTIRVKRVFWAVKLNRDLAAGTAVRITGIEGAQLLGEPLSKEGSEGA